MAHRRALRARLSSLLVAVVGTVSLVSCTDEGSPSDPPSTDGTSSSATATQPTGSPDVPLRLAVFGEPVTVRAFREIGRAYTEETGQPVEVTTYDDRRAAVSALTEQLESASTPQPPDVFLLDSVDLPDLLPSGRLAPVDEALEERGLQFGDGYQRLALTAFSADDRLQCMPLEISPHVLFINTDHVRPRDLETRGVPLPDEGRWTFEDFAAAARVIAREHEDEARFRAVHLPYDVRVLAAFVRSAGGEVVDDVDDPTTLTLDDDEAREALTAYVQLARQEEVALTTAAEDDPQALQRFARGDVAMRFGTRADVPSLREGSVPFDVRPMPSFGSPRTVADISGLCLDSESDQLEAALDLVAFAAGPAGSTILARSGAVLPANLDVAFGPIFAQQGLPPASVDVFLDSLRRSGLMPFHPEWQRVATRVERFVGRLVEGNQPLARALQRGLPRLEERSDTWFEIATEEPEPE